MIWPLRILAFFSVIGGLIGLAQIYASYLASDHAEASVSFLAASVAPIVHSPVAAISGLLAVALGFGAAYSLYYGAAKDPLPEKLGAFARAMRNRFYLDEIYEATVI